MLSKWKSLKRWQKWVVVLVCLAAIGKVSEITGLAPKTESKPIKTVQTSTSSKPKEKAKTSKSTSSEESTKKEESNSETKESSSSDKPKDITEGQMGSFIEYFKQDLTDKGLDISTYGFYNRDTVLYMTVPNDYKYYDKTELQKFADGMLAKEHEAFNVWSAINNVNYERYPMFHIKSDDGSAIASQKLNGEMKIKTK